MKFTHDQVSDQNTAKILVHHSQGGSYSKSLSHRGAQASLDAAARYLPTTDNHGSLNRPYEERSKLMDEIPAVAVEQSSIPNLHHNRGRSSRGQGDSSGRASKNRTMQTVTHPHGAGRDPLAELSRGISPMHEPERFLPAEAHLATFAQKRVPLDVHG